MTIRVCWGNMKINKSIKFRRQSFDSRTLKPVNLMHYMDESNKDFMLECALLFFNISIVELLIVV